MDGSVKALQPNDHLSLHRGRSKRHSFTKLHSFQQRAPLCTCRKLLCSKMPTMHPGIKNNCRSELIRGSKAQKTPNNIPGRALALGLQTILGNLTWSQDSEYSQIPFNFINVLYFWTYLWLRRIASWINFSISIKGMSKSIAHLWNWMEFVNILNLDSM